MVALPREMVSTFPRVRLRCYQLWHTSLRLLKHSGRRREGLEPNTVAACAHNRKRSPCYDRRVYAVVKPGYTSLWVSGLGQLHPRQSSFQQRPWKCALAMEMPWAPVLVNEGAIRTWNVRGYKLADGILRVKKWWHDLRKIPFLIWHIKYLSE